MFIKNNKQITNKSAVFRLKLSFPSVSGLALHQWNYQFVETVARFIYAKVYLISSSDRENPKRLIKQQHRNIACQ